MSNTPTTTTTSQTSRDNISHSTTSPEASKDEKDMKTKINTKAESEESSAAATLGSMGTAREHLHAQYQPSPPGPIPSHLTSSFGGTAHHTQSQVHHHQPSMGILNQYNNYTQFSNTQFFTKPRHSHNHNHNHKHHHHHPYPRQHIHQLQQVPLTHLTKMVLQNNV